eukprot:4892196-Amphidinium_carterae.1
MKTPDGPKKPATTHAATISQSTNSVQQRDNTGWSSKRVHATTKKASFQDVDSMAAVFRSQVKSSGIPACALKLFLDLDQRAVESDHEGPLQDTLDSIHERERVVNPPTPYNPQNPQKNKV